MPADAFRIAVTGDTGYDVYTEYVAAYESDENRVHNPEAAYDVYVPSGAAFMALTFASLLYRRGQSPRIVIDYLQPEVAHERKEQSVYSTLQRFLVVLYRFKDTHSERSRVLRVKETRPLIDRFPQDKNPSVFTKLVHRNGLPLNDENYDLLVIHDGAGSWRHYPPRPGVDGDPLTLVARVLDSDSAGADSHDQAPRVIVNLNHDLPEVERDATGQLRFPEKLAFWNILARDENLDKVCVVFSVNMLRNQGGAISRRLSFEQTVEDIATDLFLFEKLQLLARFKHVVIRLSMVGVLYIRTDGGTRTADLVYAPLAKGGVYRDPAEDGTIEGLNAILAASFVKMIATPECHPYDRNAFKKAMQSGLLACMRSFDHGYRVPWDSRGSACSIEDGGKLIHSLLTLGDKEIAAGAQQTVTYSFTMGAGHRPISDFLASGAHDSAKNAIQSHYHPKAARRDQTLGYAPVRSDILKRPPGSWSDRKVSWELLRDAIDPPDEFVGHKPILGQSAISRINIGVGIVMFGHDRVLNETWAKGDPDDEHVLSVLSRPELPVSSDEVRDHITLGHKPSLPSGSSKLQLNSCQAWSSIHVPLMRFGNLTVVEREEIESIRSIRNLFNGYLEKSERHHPAAPPISVAVFGPPGSGKSFVVKQLASDINSSPNRPRHGLEPVEYNVAQFRSVDELGDAITRASVINNEGKVPLVFFDEFDCAFDGRPLGWLKYFLAPMQDGVFYGVRQTIKIARAIFVFAGGIYHNFEQFDPFSDSVNPADRRQIEEIEKRFREFADQKGPDFISRLRGHINVLPVDVVNGKVKPITRRALILRSLLVKRGLVAQGRRNHVAYIDEDVVYALLTLDRYRHGARSMDAIIEMCTPIQGKIQKSSLPSRAQLNMHIDADEFFVRMYRGRFRLRSEAAANGAVGMSTKPSIDDFDIPSGSPKSAGKESPSPVVPTIISTCGGSEVGSPEGGHQSAKDGPSEEGNNSRPS